MADEGSKLDILRRCIERLDSYGAPSDDSPVMIAQDNCMFELTLEDGSFERQYTLGDLRKALQEIDTLYQMK